LTEALFQFFPPLRVILLCHYRKRRLFFFRLRTFFPSPFSPTLPPRSYHSASFPRAGGPCDDPAHPDNPNRSCPGPFEFHRLRSLSPPYGLLSRLDSSPPLYLAVFIVPPFSAPKFLSLAFSLVAAVFLSVRNPHSFFFYPFFSFFFFSPSVGPPLSVLTRTFKKFSSPLNFDLFSPFHFLFPYVFFLPSTPLQGLFPSSLS